MKGRSMQNRLIKFVLTLLFLTSIFVPVSAEPSCATVAIPTLSTSTVKPGLNIGVFGRITNCSSRKVRYTVIVSSNSSCGAETIIASNRIAFGGSESKLISVSYPVAPDTCLGSMTVSVSVYAGDVSLGSESTTLDVL